MTSKEATLTLHRFIENFKFILSVVSCAQKGLESLSLLEYQMANEQNFLFRKKKNKFNKISLLDLEFLFFTRGKEK